jgi:serine/threonine protein kinase
VQERPARKAASRECKDLLGTMLEIDQEWRIGAEEALQHEWFRLQAKLSGAGEMAKRSNREVTSRTAEW